MTFKFSFLVQSPKDRILSEYWERYFKWANCKLLITNTRFTSSVINIFASWTQHDDILRDNNLDSLTLCRGEWGSLWIPLQDEASCPLEILRNCLFPTCHRCFQLVLVVFGHSHLLLGIWKFLFFITNLGKEYKTETKAYSYLIMLLITVLDHTL